MHMYTVFYQLFVQHKQKLPFLTIVFVLLSGIGLYGQKTKSVTDTIILENGLKGLGTYHLLEADKKAVLHGVFEFAKSYEDTVDNNYLKHYTYKGSYQQGLKQGNWLYEYDYLKPSSKRFIRDLMILQPGIGEQKLVTGHFSQGLADKQWSVVSKSINDNQTTDTLFYAKVAFENNHMLGPIFGKCDSIQVRGEVDENGFLHGTWTFIQKRHSGNTVSEHRTYEHGVLVKHFFELNKQSYEVKHVGLDQEFSASSSDWEEVEVSQHYFNIIYFTNIGVEKDLSLAKTNDLIQRSNAFLKTTLFSFGFHQDAPIWAMQKGGQNLAVPKLKVRKYPYQKGELKRLQASQKLLIESIADIEKYLQNPQVEINRHYTVEIAKYYQGFKLSLQELLKIKQTIDLLQLPAFEFINRQEMLPYVHQKVTFPSEIQFECNDSNMRSNFPFPDLAVLAQTNIEGLHALVTQFHERIKSALDTVNPILERNKTREQIQELEAALIQKKDSILALFNNEFKSPDYNSFHQLFKQKMMHLAEEEFKLYSKRVVTERVDLIPAKVACFTSYVEFYFYLVRLQENRSQIADLYTRTVWNPFTFTDMQETVKERVYNAYYNQVLPFVLSELNRQLSCNEIEKGRATISKLFNKMKELREQDTKELERAIRRANEPSQLFNLLMNSNEIENAN